MDAAAGSVVTPAPLSYGSLDDEAEEFVRAILDRDMCDNLQTRLAAQQAEYGSFLRTPLPLDRASEPYAPPHVIYQMLHSLSTTAEELWRQVRNVCVGDDQAQRVVVAAAAKGVGKTHAAYAVGAQYAPVVMLRVAQAAVDASGRPLLTAPFEWLDSFLVAVDRRVAGSASTDAALYACLSDCAQSMLEVVVFAHVLVALDVASYALQARPALSNADLRELLQRFARNGRGERIVAARCRTLEAHMCLDAVAGVQWFPTSWRTAARDHLRSALDAIMPRLRPAHEAPLLVVWDEASALRDRWRNLFITERDFVDLRRDTSVSLSAAAVSTLHRTGRGGLYAALNVACKCAASCGWAQFLTGTALEINEFVNDATPESPIRKHARLAPPRALLTTLDMQAQLRLYFGLPDAVFEHAPIRTQLERVRGRPLYFVHGVFEPLTQAVLSGDTRGWDSLEPSVLAERLLALWKAPIAEVYRGQIGMCGRLLTERGAPVSRGGDGTTRSLLRPIVDCVLQGRDKLQLQTFSLQHMAVVHYGVLPEGAAVAADADAAEWITYDLAAEPLTYDALQQVVHAVAREDRKRHKFLLQLLPSDGRGAAAEFKGQHAETVLAYDFCLRVMAHVRESAAVADAAAAGSAGAGKGGVAYMPLSSLVAPMCARKYSNVLAAFSTRAHRLVRLTATESDPQVLQQFVRRDGSIDNELFLTGLPNVMGGDIAFVACRQVAGRTEHRLVVAQLKNQEENSLWAAAQTLAPGFQFLGEKARAALARFAFDGTVVQVSKANIPAVFPRFVEWTRSCPPTQSFLFTNWIRLACLARPLDDALQLALLQQDEDEQAVARTRKLSTPETELADESPLLVLRLNSDEWLDAEVRRALVGDTTGTIQWPTKQEFLFASLVPPSVALAGDYVARTGTSVPPADAVRAVDKR